MLSGPWWRKASCPQSVPGTCDGDGGCREGDRWEDRQQCVDQTANHLMSVWTALCRLLAFRVRLRLEGWVAFWLAER